MATLAPEEQQRLISYYSRLAFPHGRQSVVAALDPVSYAMRLRVLRDVVAILGYEFVEAHGHCRLVPLGAKTTR